MANINKLNKISTGKSKWIDNAKERQKNKEWLKHSQKIAFKILQTLSNNKISQKELAEKIHVSPQQINKIVKGKENMTLETIAKLEKALGINLIFNAPKVITKKVYIKKEVFMYHPVLNEQSYKATKQKTFDPINMQYNLGIYSEKTLSYGKA